MTEFKILNVEELNENADWRTAHNGGGYYQERITFEIDGSKGIFEDTSCGDFGTRYYLEIEGQPGAVWGTMEEEAGLDYTRFNGREKVYPKLFEEFGVPCDPNMI